MRVRVLLVAYALFNAILYSLLLPLWEGFDEPFHFAYVQQLGNLGGLPDPRTDRLSGEVGASLLLAPASYAVKQNLPQVTVYGEYFSWPVEKRQAARRELYALATEGRWERSNFLNYQAHHPPLAYLALALPERVLAEVSLPLRVAVLRILAALAGSLLLLKGAARLFEELGVRELYKDVALFCLLSSQMTWATLAHIGNDWLAVPLAVWFLVASIRYWRCPSRRGVLLAAALLAAGLLTKAYFVAFVPFLAGLCLWRKRWREAALAALILIGLAGPWYARNLIRYEVLTGTQEARSGINLAAVWRAAPELDWPAVMSSSARGALWTGNNTFSTFSASTLHLVIGLILVGLGLWATSRPASAEWVAFSYCALFALALAYSAVMSHVYTYGASTGPSPWYSQVLFAPVLGLALLGASRWGRAGRFTAIAMGLLFGYVLVATYAVKLIPLYGGYEGRTSLSALMGLYGSRSGMLMANLDTVALAPAWVLVVLTGVVILFTLAGATMILPTKPSAVSTPSTEGP